MDLNKSLIPLYKNEYQKIKFQILEVDINKSNIELATDYIKKLTGYIKKLDDERKDKLKPLRDAIEQMSVPYKDLNDKLTELNKALREKLTTYQVELSRTEDAERLAKIKEHKLNALEEEQGLLEWDRLAGVQVDERLSKIKEKKAEIESKEMFIQINSEQASSHIRKTYDFEIIDENLVPRPYCSPDSKKIKEAIKDGMRMMTGLRIFEKESVVIK